MATITILKDDKWVNIDGYQLNLDSIDLPANVHAIQWTGSEGWIEYNDGTSNETITSMSAYTTITDAHAVKKAEEEAAVEAEKQAQIALEATYGYKRQQAYASIEEQLDQQYWDSVNGTTTWKDGIAAVKSAHPK